MRMLSLRVFVLVQALALLALPQSVTAGAPPCFDVASHRHVDENADTHHGNRPIDLPDAVDDTSSERWQQAPVNAGISHPCCAPGFNSFAAIMPEAPALLKSRVSLLVPIGGVTALRPFYSLPLQHPPELAVS